MKNGLLIFIIFLFGAGIYAQDTTEVQKVKKWKISGTPGVSFSQNSFSNWLSGGANMSALSFDSKVYANYNYQNVKWENSLNLGYGLNHQKEQGTRKQIDKIDLLSTISFIGPNEIFRYSASLNLKTQFADGYDYRSSTQWYFNSTFLAPGYLTGSVGIDYIGIEHLTIHVAPLAEKTTIVREAYYDKKVVNAYWDGYEPRFYEEEGFNQDFPDPTPEQLEPYERQLDSTTTTYGLAWRENSKFETGMLVQVIYSQPEIIKNIGFKTRLDIFNSYTNFSNPDIDWEVWLSLKVNKRIAFNINTQMIYDNDIKFQETDDMGIIKNVSKIQLRNFMGLGVSYTFDNGNTPAKSKKKPKKVKTDKYYNYRAN